MNNNYLDTYKLIHIHSKNNYIKQIAINLYCSFFFERSGDYRMILKTKFLKRKGGEICKNLVIRKK